MVLWSTVTAVPWATFVAALAMAALQRCCGTFRSHINAAMKRCEGVAPRKLIEKPKYPVMQLSGLGPAFIGPRRGLQPIGKRCNLMGSAKFKKLVDAYKWDKPWTEHCPVQD